MGDRGDLILAFLEEYQRFPCLWQKSSPDYKNRVKRDAAENALLPLSGLSTIKEVRQKIRSIRGTYNQEILKIKKSKGTGTGRKDVYVPKLTWFPIPDSFLRQNYDNSHSHTNLELGLRETDTQLTNVESEEEETNSSYEKQENNLLSTQDPEVENNSVAATPTISQRSSLLPKKKQINRRKRHVMDGSLDKAVVALQQEKIHTSLTRTRLQSIQIASQKPTPLTVHAQLGENSTEAYRFSAPEENQGSQSFSTEPPTPSNNIHSPNENITYHDTDEMEIPPEEGMCMYFTNWANGNT